MDALDSTTRTPLSVLQDVFGYPEFRDGQEKIVNSLVQGKDTLVIMPTGGGKSLCYQIPALLREGTALIISPLISLMQDQVDALRRKGVEVGLLNSLQSYEEQRACLEGMENGTIKMVYVAPERLRNESFRRAIKQTKISMIAVDEAHCLSQWGHDFRPDYMQIGDFAKFIGNPVVGAFTATATEIVREDISKNLQLRTPSVFISGFSRPNLNLQVIHVDKVVEKYSKLRKLVEEHQTGIVYCATRKRVDEISEEMARWDISFVSYHAGMSDEDRNRSLEKFVTKQVDVAIATNAFGMGIDRGDIRFVAHFELPGSVEAYYQEVGRAGRDGKPSVCHLYFNFSDKRIQDFFIEGRNPDEHLIREVYNLLRQRVDDKHEMVQSIDSLKEELGKGANPMAISSVITMLARNKIIERFDVPGKRARGTRLLHPDWTAQDLPLDRAALQSKKERDSEKLNAMISFVYSKKSRHEWILEYFGDQIRDDSSLGQCDNQKRLENRREGSDAELQLLRKCLSGVARMSHRTSLGWSPRFGKNRIIQVLRGSRRKEILDKKLDQLSTFGLLKDEEEPFVRAMFEAMEDGGLACFEGEEFPMFTLTMLGEEVMRGKNIALEWPAREDFYGENIALQSPAERRGLEKFTLSKPQEEVLRALRKKRAQMARETQKPAYTIFTNKTLEILSRRCPTSLEEAEGIPGVGDFKKRTVLPAFLDVIATFK